MKWKPDKEHDKNAPPNHIFQRKKKKPLESRACSRNEMNLLDLDSIIKSNNIHFFVSGLNDELIHYIYTSHTFYDIA